MRLLRGTFLVSMLWLGACSAKHLPPQPITGMDIQFLHKGDIVPFNGVEFSPYYLNEYLQWKNN